MSATVRKLIESKGSEIVSIQPDSLVIDAIRIMAEKGIGSILVLDAEGNLKGIMSERDSSRRVLLKEKSPRETKVSEVMSAENLTTVTMDTSVPDCMSLMTDHRIRHLPVLDDGKIVGVISIGDVVKFMLQEKEMMVRNLEKYIEGSM